MSCCDLIRSDLTHSKAGRGSASISDEKRLMTESSRKGLHFRPAHQMNREGVCVFKSFTSQVKTTVENQVMLVLKRRRCKCSPLHRTY